MNTEGSERNNEETSGGPEGAVITIPEETGNEGGDPGDEQIEQEVRPAC